MIDGLALDYAASRAVARLAWRPDAPLWRRLHAARGLRALLDAARNALVGNYLTGLSAQARCADIDVAFRAQCRARVTELAGWAPVAWRPALRWTAHLLDLSAVAHLWTQAPAAWMAADPVLARYAAPGLPPSTRRALLIAGPLAPLGRALAVPAAAPRRRDRRPVPTTDPAPVPVVLAAWLAHWEALWPPASPAFDASARNALRTLRDDVLAHRRRFAQLPTGDTGAAREAFAQRMLARLRLDPVQPAALFAYLVVLALDLERLRAECLAQAFDATRAADAVAEAA